tara:strand:- start:3166 stop:3282 length:117 start_codon:yes stop_codon:yes gene_type:complete
MIICDSCFDEYSTFPIDFKCETCGSEIEKIGVVEVVKE